MDSQCPGIAPDAFLVSLKVVDKNGSEFDFSFSLDIPTKSVLKAFDQVLVENCTIVVMSFGGRDLNESVINQKMDVLLANGISLVASAGNDGPSWGYG